MVDQLRISCEKLGLDYEAIRMHGTRIKQAIASHPPHLKISETCTLENQGILPANCFGLGRDKAFDGIVSFVPAAGAASRYFAGIGDLIAGLESGETEPIKMAVVHLAKEGAEDWPLPDLVRAAGKNPQLVNDWTESQIRMILESFKQPKALQPCVLEGTSFLELKVAENKKLQHLSGEVFVCSPEFKEDFCDRLGTDVSVMVQGPEFSTIRFDASGEPIYQDNDLSMVPAGHGALSHLFPEVKAAFPDCHSVLIRNVDNVMGTKEHVIAAAQQFANQHQILLDHMKLIRTSLGQNKDAEASAAGIKLLTSLGETPEGSDLAILWQLMDRLFHPLQSIERNREELIKLVNRPVNTMGMVPNSGADVGGTPCFVESKNEIHKVCLEVPHASKEDKIKWLENPDLATHFNPGFVCAELTDRVDYYTSQDTEFWLLSKKPYLDETVLYHELALYELLGNSHIANAAFIEIPRDLFNPHKSLANAAKHHLKQWVD